MNPELLAKLKGLIREDRFDGIQRLIKNRAPARSVRTETDKRYEQMRNWKRSADMDRTEGKQTVGPDGFKGNPAMDRRLAQIDRRNQAIEKAEDDVLNSPEIQELIRMTQAYKDKEKVTMPLSESGDKFTKLAVAFDNDRNELYKVVSRQLDAEDKALQEEMVKMMDIPDLTRDHPVAVDWRRRRRDWIERKQALDEQYAADNRNPHLPTEAWKRFSMGDTPEGKYFDDHLNYEYDIPQEIVKAAGNTLRESGNIKVPEVYNKISPQKHIQRFHTTKLKNMPSIFKKGLDPAYSGTGFGDQIAQYADDADYDGVYTIAEAPWLKVDRGTAYTPDFSEVTLELQIPKGEYKELGRRDHNVEDDIIGVDKSLQTVNEGGRTDIFTDKISPEYIVNAYDHKMRPIDFNLLRNNKDIKPMLEKFFKEFYKD